MIDLGMIGNRVAERRKTLKLSQLALARKAGVSRATLDALENGRAGEMGFSKLTKLLAALGLELTLQPASSQRPTLEELMQEDRDDQGLDPELSEKIRIEADYFEKHTERMRYPAFRAQHLFVGSGVIEAGCKTVKGSRLKQSGMFWTVRGANANIALRCRQLNNRFEDYREARRPAA